MAEQKDSAPNKDAHVYSIVRASRCHNCDRKLEPTAIVKLISKEEDREVLCDKCSGFETLEFLPGGNAKITQLAKKASSRFFVVLKWSELWKTYERQGLLVESSAIDEAESVAGATARGRKKLTD